MLAMNTDFHGQSRKSAELKNTLVKIAQAGFSHIHWCHEFHSSYVYSVYEMLQIKEWCDELGLLVKGVHASAGETTGDLKNYASANEYNRLAGLDLIMNRIDLAYILNTDAIVLHYNGPWANDKIAGEHLDDLRPVFRSFDELEPYCKIRHIKICIENGGGMPDFCRPYYDSLFERYGADYLGLCFDTGHANLACGKKDLLAYPQRYGSRLFMIHADDNQGKADEHLIPFEGGFDWEGFAPLLARSAYSFPVVIESSYRAEGDDTAWLKKAFDAGSRFAAMVEKYR